MQDETEKLDALKLDTSAFRVLCYLSFKEAALKPSQIAERIGEKPSTVRARLTELKDAGLVRATPGGYVSALNPYDILMKLYRDIKRESSR
ncbi:MAG: helix-turn-helix domain-containing protein [Candidatus Bathyarchaeota archaeon]|nr:helix-turn-helix domain-containing protein [Candidatus Bathyarchaeota archaeon]